MKYLLNNTRVIDVNSPWNGKTVNILINNDTIEKIDEKVIDAKGAEVHDLNGTSVSTGFCDLYVSSGDPGHEYREDIHSLANAAAAGGFTIVCTIADNHPVTQTKAQVEYIINKSRNSKVSVLPVGAVTENFDGTTPTEMFDMHHAGAVAFSDIPNSFKDSGVLLRALQYVQPFDGLVVTLPYDKTLVADGQVNESEISVRMGMKGITNLSEYSILQRDIELLRYSGGKLHVAGISTKESVDLIRRAKKELNITCSVFVHHLISEESDVKNFNSNYKVFPPLRTSDDRDALIQGLQDGTIDCISTQHTPLDIDCKNVEFEYASFGITGLETAFGLLNKRLDGIIPQEKLIALLSTNPRRIIKQENAIKENAIADLAIFNFDEAWSIEEKNIRSKSKNTPYIGAPLKGKVKAVFSKGKYFAN